MNAAQSVTAMFSQGPAPTSPLVAAVLPSSRSVQVGNTVTAFATIINTGTTATSACDIAPIGSLPLTFLYATTDPATNAVTGAPNTPVTITPNNGAQTFVIALTPSAPIAPTDVAFSFACQDVAQASPIAGLNTLLLSASSTPVPDIIALAATAPNDGILHIPGDTASNAFAVATVNVGASSEITATANTGAASLPLTISLCQTDPSSGQCLGTPVPASTGVFTTIDSNATPTFAIFATASDIVQFDPAHRRIFVQFSDASEIVRGSTSVAVCTTGEPLC
jgi:hypothetical protein